VEANLKELKEKFGLDFTELAEDIKKGYCAVHGGGSTAKGEALEDKVSNHVPVVVCPHCDFFMAPAGMVGVMKKDYLKCPACQKYSKSYKWQLTVVVPLDKLVDVVAEGTDV